MELLHKSEHFSICLLIAKSIYTSYTNVSTHVKTKHTSDSAITDADLFSLFSQGWEIAKITYITYGHEDI